MSPQLISTDELAKILGVKKSWLYRMVSRKKLPHYRCGKYIKFNLREVLRYLKVKVKRK